MLLLEKLSMPQLHPRRTCKLHYHENYDNQGLKSTCYACNRQWIQTILEKVTPFLSRIKKRNIHLNYFGPNLDLILKNFWPTQHNLNALREVFHILRITKCFNFNIQLITFLSVMKMQIKSVFKHFSICPLNPYQN